MGEPVQMLVWEDSRPFPRRWAWLLVPGAKRAMEDYVRRRVLRAGGVLITEPVATARTVDGRVVVRAEAYALCPPGAATEPDIVAPPSGLDGED